MDPGRKLTREEFEEVVRRAAELASSEPDGDEAGLSEGELFRIAGEVGLPARHVERALAEVRTKGPALAGWDRVLGASSVAASRVVEGDLERIRATVDDFLVAGQLLQSVRKGRRTLVYRPAVDWVSRFARAAGSTARRYYWASAKQVTVDLQELGPGETLVRLEVDPGIRENGIAGLVLGAGGGGVVVAVGAGVLLASVAPVAVAALAGALVGTGTTATVSHLIRAHHRRQMEEVGLEIEGVLDQLETGGALEPPPASWRRWVQRQARAFGIDLFKGESPDLF